METSPKFPNHFLKIYSHLALPGDPCAFHGYTRLRVIWDNAGGQMPGWSCGRHAGLVHIAMHCTRDRLALCHGKAQWRLVDHRLGVYFDPHLLRGDLPQVDLDAHHPVVAVLADVELPEVHLMPVAARVCCQVRRTRAKCPPALLQRRKAAAAGR
jgi:hypothetical protein